MKFTLLGCKFNISVYFAAVLAVLLLFDKTGIMSVSLFCTFIHEVAHIVAMKLTGQMPISVEMRVGRLNIIKPESVMSYKNEIMIAAAGAVMNIIAGGIFYAVYFFNPRIEFFLLFIVNFSVALLNLLPVNGLDGGKIICLIVDMRSEIIKKHYIFNFCSVFIIAFLICFGIYIFLKNGKNPTLLLMGIYLLVIYLISFHR